MKKYLSIMKLAGLLLLVPVAVYLLAVSDTVRLYKELCQAQEEAENVAPVTETDIFDTSVPMLSNGVLMMRIAELCSENRVSVSHYSPEDIDHEGNIHLVSARLMLTGDFKGLLKVLAYVEELEKIKISGTAFRIARNGRNARILTLELKLLQIENHA